MIWATVSSWSSFCWLYRASPSLAAKNIILFQCWPSGDVHLQSLLLYCWKRLFAMISAFSWQNSISLCPASFRTPRPNLLVTPGVSLLPTFAFQSPVVKRTSFLAVSSKKSVGLHRTVQLQLLQHYCLRHRLGLLWYWMICLERTEIILSFLWLHPSTAFWTLLLSMMTTPFLLGAACPR